MAEPAPIWVVHATANRNSRHWAGELAQRGRLDAFWTTFSGRADAPLRRCLPARLRRELARRDLDPALAAHTRTAASLREWGRLLGARLGGRRWTGPRGPWGIDAVHRTLDRAVARAVSTSRLPPGVVYAYEDGALETFEAARARGWLRVYELPIAYWQPRLAWLRAEAVRRPEWACTIEGLDDPPEKLERKRRELELAELVVCPSQFVADSIPAELRSGRRIVVVPYGSEGAAAAMPPPRDRSGPLRVLFAGAMTQRKGLADLFDAVRALPESAVELTVLGSPVAPLAFYHRVGPRFRHLPPRPHAEVLQAMRAAELFILPSIVEGRALVVAEALGAACPVVVTPATGTEDIVRSGENGWVVPTGDVAALTACLEDRLRARAALDAASAAAWRAAAARPWGLFASEVLAAIAEVRR